MFGRTKKPPYLLHYLSLAKLEQIYGQISDFDIQTVRHASDTEAKGKVGAKLAALFQLFSGSIQASAHRQTVMTKEGSLNSFNKLRQVLAYYEDGGFVADLRECITSKTSPAEAVLYRYSGLFSVVPSSERAFVHMEQQKEDSIPVYFELESTKWSRSEENPNGKTLIFKHNHLVKSHMCVLRSKVMGYTIEIACSYKYFIDADWRRKEGARNSENWDEDVVEFIPSSSNHFFHGEGTAEFDSLLFITYQKGKKLFGSPLVLFSRFQPRFNLPSRSRK